MSKLVGVSGAHGVGKTTILKAITELGNSVIRVDDFSVPRSVQDDYGMTLAEVVADQDRIPEYQDRIIARKSERNAHLRDSMWPDEIVFVDRTGVDFFAYANQWLHPERPAKHMEWLAAYEKKCAESMKEYDLVIYIPPMDFPFVPEVQRATADTQRLNADFCEQFLYQYRPNSYYIKTLDVQERVAEFLMAARTYAN